MAMAEYGSISFEVPPTASSKTEEPQPRPRQQLGSACDECRRRKLRCDRKKPQCLACANSGVTCVTREDYTPRGPKKGHVGALRNKIAMLEAKLSEREKLTPPASRDQSQSSRHSQHSHSHSLENSEQSSDGSGGLPMPLMSSGDPATDFNINAWLTPINTQPMNTSAPDVIEESYSSLLFPSRDLSPIGSYLSPVVCSDLDKLFFDRVHSFAPMLQKSRYLSWSRQLDKPKEKLCLQYAMWTLAASLSSQFQMMRGELYAETRRLLDMLETENQDTLVKHIEQPQAWMLLSIYELISENFPRGMISAGRAFRLVQLMRLYNIDRNPSIGLQVDWVDTESMRRTFWVAYCLDRFTSVVDGLPLTFDEREIGTRLPAPESNFMNGQPTTMWFLCEAIESMDSYRADGNVSSDVELSTYAECVVIATMCGRTLNLKREIGSELSFTGGGYNGGSNQDPQNFFQQHQAINSLLMARIRKLSTQILPAQGHLDPMLMFLAMTAYMTILLLCETMESRPSTPQSQGSPISIHHQRSLSAIRELGLLIALLNQVNHFETHPFTPIPLLLSARFCLSHAGYDDAYVSQMQNIVAALRSLADVNGLAHTFLRLLGLAAPDNLYVAPNMAYNGSSH